MGLSVLRGRKAFSSLGGEYDAARDSYVSPSGGITYMALKRSHLGAFLSLSQRRLPLVKKRPVLQIRRQLRSAEEDCQGKLDDRQDAGQSRAAQQWRRRPGTTARRLCAAGAWHRTQEKAGEGRDDQRC